MANLWTDLKSLLRLWPFLKEDRILIFASFLLIPFLSLLQIATPLSISKAIDLGVMEKNFDNLQFYGLMFFGIVILSYILRSLQSMLAAISVHRMILRTRRKLIHHIIKLPMSSHEKTSSGALVTRTTSDFDNLSEALNQGVLTSVVDIAVVLGSLIGIFLLHKNLSLVTLITFPIMIFIITYFSAKLKKYTGIVRSKVSLLNGFMTEGVYGLNTIKSLCAHQDVERKFNILNLDAKKSQLQVVILDACMYSIMDGITSITIGIALYVAIQHLFGVEVVTAGVLVAFIQALQNVYEPLTALGSKMAMLQGAIASLERIFRIFDQKEEKSGLPNNLLEAKFAEKTEQALVSFEHVDFSYVKDHKVLENIHFKLYTGQSLALVGATGSGKSSIVKLLSKLYTGYEGKIYFSGEEIDNIDNHSLRSSFGIVSQEVNLFSGSIRHNLCIGLKDTPTDEMLWEYLDSVSAKEFVAKFSEGLDFKLNEHGSNLSFGQRQLLCFARALARNPKILILDEATSSVDPDSEKLIQEAIPKLMEGRSSLVVAHRLSTIQNCDEILVLRQGRIIQRGNYQDLSMDKDGYFYELIQAAERSKQTSLPG